MNRPVVRMINRLFAFLSKCVCVDCFYFCSSKINIAVEDEEINNRSRYRYGIFFKIHS